MMVRIASLLPVDVKDRTLSIKKLRNIKMITDLDQL